jgi:coenzyme F420-dependent glucose-6-phosphate dehydrogenase
MTRIGFHASHEQLAPSRLLGAVAQAEAAGFQGAMCPDHFAPWSERQGQSGHAWCWLGAALQATALPFGVVTAPGQRYHPAVVAQAAATLAEMFPGRFWMALGSGEALNEHITGDPWPPKPARRARLKEAVDVIRALFAGETVSHRGSIHVDRAKLYTRPAEPPPILAAAVSAETAEWAGAWADGLITVNQGPEELEKVVAAFRRGGGRGKPLYLQVHVSLAGDEATALQEAHDEWRVGALPGSLLWDLATPEQFDEAARFICPEDVRSAVRVSADPERHVAWLRDDVALGFEQIYLHGVGRDQGAFIAAFAERVLPALQGPSPGGA